MISEYIPLHKKELMSELPSYTTKLSKSTVTHTWSMVSEIPENKYKNINVGRSFFNRKTQKYLWQLTTY